MSSTTATTTAATTDAPVRLAVIVGSTREGRFAPVVAAWFAEVAKARADLTVDVVDPAETPLPYAMPGFAGPSPDDAALLGAVSPRLAAADAFVVVTPEYNHSFPGALKHLIDLHFDEWQAKPVGFVAYGGLAGGLRAVEQLRQVFAELHAVTVRDTVSFHGAAGAFDGDTPKEPHGCTAAAGTMLDQLVWWAQALREAKAARPYGS